MSKNETENSRANNKKADDVAAAVAALRRGDVIVYPTETLYGLGADALNSAAVEKVFQLKGRDPNNPIPVLVADREMLGTLVKEISAQAEKLMARFWPGPLTLVLPARPSVPRPLLNSTDGVGVRISSAPIASALVRALGHPLTATSANPSGRPGARTVSEAKLYFAGQIDIFINGGELRSKSVSTVVEIRGNSFNIIRPGEIGKAELEQVVGTEITLS